VILGDLRSVKNFKSPSINASSGFEPLLIHQSFPKLSDSSIAGIDKAVKSVAKKSGIPPEPERITWVLVNFKLNI
jgi:hypothetical protein